MLCYDKVLEVLKGLYGDYVGMKGGYMRTIEGSGIKELLLGVPPEGLRLELTIAVLWASCLKDSAWPLPSTSKAPPNW